MLSIGFVLLFVYTILTTVASSPILETREETPTRNPSPVCVDAAEYPAWNGLNNAQIDPYNCAYAILGMQSLLNDTSPDDSFDFYSKGRSLGLAPKGAWRLPEGTRGGLPGPHNCAAVIRMRHDFDPGALPLPNGRYLDPKSPGKQTSTWHEITTALDVLQADCVSNQHKGGWVLISENIVAGLWPSQSGVDNSYGYKAVDTDLVRYMLENGNSTDFEP